MPVYPGVHLVYRMGTQLVAGGVAFDRPIPLLANKLQVYFVVWHADCFLLGIGTDAEPAETHKTYSAFPQQKGPRYDDAPDPDVPRGRSED